MNNYTFNVRHTENGKYQYFFRFNCIICKTKVFKNIRSSYTPYNFECDECGRMYKALGITDRDVVVEITTQRLGYPKNFKPKESDGIFMQHTINDFQYARDFQNNPSPYKHPNNPKTMEQFKQMIKEYKP